MFKFEYVTQHGKRFYITNEDRTIFFEIDRGNLDRLDINYKPNEIFQTQEMKRFKDEYIKILSRDYCNEPPNSAKTKKSFSGLRFKMKATQSTATSLSTTLRHFTYFLNSEEFKSEYSSGIVSRSTKLRKTHIFHTKKMYRTLLSFMNEVPQSFVYVNSRYLNRTYKSFSLYAITDSMRNCRENSPILEKSRILLKYLRRVQFTPLTAQEYEAKTSVLNKGHTFENEFMNKQLNENAKREKEHNKFTLANARESAKYSIRNWYSRHTFNYPPTRTYLSNFAKGMKQIHENSMRRRNESSGKPG